MLKRTILATVIGYIVLGIGTRLMERRGLVVCQCEPDCWCKRPGLSLFRWVFPRWHKESGSREERMRLGPEIVARKTQE